MKKYLLILILFTIITISGLVVILKSPKNNVINIPSEDETISINEENIVENDKDKENVTSYKTVWITVNDNNKLFLYSNLNEKLSSDELSTKYSCEYLVSGGFYNTINNHIGLFITEGEAISEIIDSLTFNGIFSVSKDKVPSITDYPVFSPRISLQSGPLLIKSGKKQVLNMENDENARRVVVAIDGNNKIYFISIFGQSNKFDGPKLVELPALLDNLNNAKNLDLIDALNLDGGAHSAFISNLDTLSEASIIGSFFCVKP